MKYTSNYYCFNRFVFRIPIFTFNKMQNFLTGKINIYDILKDPIFEEAIFLSSPELSQKMKLLLDGNEQIVLEESELTMTIYKFLSRMSSRCTPFGLFAGCGIGTIGDKSEISVDTIDKCSRHTRLDMSLLGKIHQSIIKDINIRKKLTYYPNSTINPIGSKIRYIEYIYRGDKRIYKLVEIDSSSIIKRILVFIKGGRTYSELLRFIKRFVVSGYQSVEYLNRLIDNQLLVSEIDLNVTGQEYLNRLIEILIEKKSVGSIRNLLTLINAGIKELDIQLINSIKKYSLILKLLEDNGISYNRKYVFQTDLYIATNYSVINKDIVVSLRNAIDVFCTLSTKKHNINLKLFRERFIKRYENANIELLKVLDTEIGIGYLQEGKNSDGDYAPLISDIVLPIKREKNEEIHFSKFELLIIKKLTDIGDAKPLEIVISDNDIINVNNDNITLPCTFSVKVSVIENSTKQYPNGRILFEGFGGDSATHLLGRFTHGSDEINEMVQEVANIEKREFRDSIIAEIVHLPDERAGNVIQHQKFYDYEIPVLTHSCISDKRKIQLSDILVSVENDEVVLKSKRLNKRILPRLSNAHNYTYNALPIYQFLCDLQNQNSINFISKDYNNLFKLFSYIPRIVYKDIIFSPAIWSIKSFEIRHLLNLTYDNDLMEVFYGWKTQFNLPEYVLLISGDNRLLICLSNLTSIKVLLDLVKRNDEFILMEFVFNHDNALVKQNCDVYTNELIFTFYRN